MGYELIMTYMILEREHNIFKQRRSYSG